MKPKQISRNLTTCLIALTTLLAHATSSDFETFPLGKFTSGKDASGTWQAASNQAEIFNKGRNSQKSLHILGGNKQVELTLPQPIPHNTNFSFSVERWTNQGTCTLELSAQVKGTWKKILSDHKATVGTFNHQITNQLPAGTTAIRISCSSKGGIIIDDFEMQEHGPIHIHSIKAHYPIIPIFKRLDVNPIASIQFQTTGSQNPPTFDALQLTFNNPNTAQQIASINLIESKTIPSYKSKAPIIATLTNPNNNIILLRPNTKIDTTKTYWISLNLKENTSNNSKIQLTISAISINGKPTVFNSTNKPTPIPIGYAVRKMNEDGAHAYRIPGLVKTKQGTLLSVYDIRYKNSGDLPGDIDVGCSRSTNGGQTWENMTVAIDMGNDPKFNHDGVGDPSILVDEQTGRIWISAIWSHGPRGWNGSGPGLTPEQTGQFILVYSDDDGKSWSKPINITKMVKKPEWNFLLQGPGAGITMKNGTLVFPTQFRDATGTPYSSIMTSQNHGKTWTMGTGIKSNTTEAQVVELENNTLMLNCRDNRGGSRTIGISHDLGQTWTMHETDRKALIEPVCMASILRVDSKKHGNLILFSNPHSTQGRKNMSLQISRDNAKSWSQAHLYDERTNYGYSCLAPVDDNHIGVLYEGSDEIFFLKIPYTDLLP